MARSELAAAAGRYFPAGYADSRARFRAACAAAMRCWNRAIHYPPALPSPAGWPRVDRDLTIDIAYASRGNPRLVILQAGLHGVEAFAGAAVLQLALERHLGLLLDAGYDVLLIHAANPWGFANLRRVDGNNVDLNRNFPAAPQAGPGVWRNPAYDALRDLTERPGPVTDRSLESLRLALETGAAYLRHGFSVSFLGNGTHGGQWSNPEGFEFGGKEPSQQVRFLREEIAPVMAAHPRHVVFLDIHTGLGAANGLTIFTGRDRTEEEVRGLRRFARGWEGAGIRVQTPEEGAYQTMGDVIDFVPGLVPQRVTAVTLEWGTIGESIHADLSTNARMILEHQAWFHGCTSPALCAEVKRSFVELFNPDSPAFRASVLRQADAVLSRLEEEGLGDRP